MLLEASQITPKSGISADNLYMASHIILPVDVERVSCWPISQRGKLRLREDNQLSWGHRVIDDRALESH